MRLGANRCWHPRIWPPAGPRSNTSLSIRRLQSFFFSLAVDLPTFFKRLNPSIRSFSLTPLIRTPRRKRHVSYRTNISVALLCVYIRINKSRKQRCASCWWTSCLAQLAGRCASLLSAEGCGERVNCREKMCREKSEMTEKGKIAFSAPRSNSAAMNHLATVNVVMSPTLRSTSINQLIMNRASITTASAAAAFEWKALPGRNVVCQVSMTNATVSGLIDFYKNRCRSARHSGNSRSNFAQTLRLISFACFWSLW